MKTRMVYRLPDESEHTIEIEQSEVTAKVRELIALGVTDVIFDIADFSTAQAMVEEIDASADAVSPMREVFPINMRVDYNSRPN